MPLPSISSRAANVIASPMRKYVPLVKAAEARGVKVIKLNIGDPDLETPRPFFDTIDAQRGPRLPYAPSSGLPACVEAWKEYYKQYGIDLKSEQILPTTGGSEAIQFSLMLVADPGDEVLVFEPLYSGFSSAAGMFNVRFVPIPLRLENGFRLPDVAELAKLVTPKTKALIVINPDNPTGKVWSDEELSTLVRFTTEHGIFLISDETYREIVFQGKPRCILDDPAARPHTIVIDSLSKRFSAPGARLGAIVSYNEDVMKSALKFAMARLSAPMLEQEACIPLLKNAATYTAPLAAEYLRRRDAVCEELEKISGVKFHRPGGAFYIVVKLPVADADAFVRYLLTDFSHEGETVMVTPIRDFYATPKTGVSEIRIACVHEVETLRRGISLLSFALKAFKNVEA